MLKEALKRAFWVACGVTVGGVFLPRAIFSGLPQPPLFWQALIAFIGGYLGSFSIYLLLEWLKSRKCPPKS